MGEVYRARDVRLERDVALKVLQSSLTDSPPARERFQFEARAVAALQHPNICAIYDVGEASTPTNVSYLVMELLQGETLQERLTRGPLDASSLMDTAIALVDALEAAHGAGLVHRDLKRANVFLTPRGPKILDFGLAKAMAASAEVSSQPTIHLLTNPGRTVWTVAYMSPEQVRGESLDGRTDLFSFGLVLYEMATGRQAFSGNTSGVIFHAILSQAPTSVLRLKPELPPKLEEIIGKALDKDRDMRYHSASELRTDLKRLKRDTEAGRSTGMAAVVGAVGTTPAAVPHERGVSSDSQMVAAPLKRHQTSVVVATLVAVTAVCVAAWFRFYASQQTETALKNVPFASLGGEESGPAFSPEGNAIAFAWGGEKDDHQDIYVKLIGAGTPLRLTTH